jgi:hypothetical protein
MHAGYFIVSWPGRLGVLPSKRWTFWPLKKCRFSRIVGAAARFWVALVVMTAEVVNRTLMSL